MTEAVRVLSIDGGGIRGIIPAMVLAEIERRAGKPVAKMFDLIAGTSTGGILGLGLVKPKQDGAPEFTAEQLVALYEQEGQTIFHRSTWHRITALENLVEEKYDAKGIEEVLHRYFGETRLSAAITDVLITSYEIERRLPFFFRSARARTQPDYDFTMKAVARATSAAPTYFEPERIDIAGDDYYTLVDGGVFANNPGLCAFVEAKTEHPDTSEFVVLSLGTGELTRRLPYDEVRGWGLAQWAQPLLGVVFDGVSDTVNYQLQQLCSAGDDHVQRYFRLQTTLFEGNDDMDDASRTNVRVLKLIAEKLIQDHGPEIDALVALINR